MAEIARRSRAAASGNPSQSIAGKVEEAAAQTVEAAADATQRMAEAAPRAAAGSAEAVREMRTAARDAAGREVDPRPTQPPSAVDAPAMVATPPAFAQMLALWWAMWLWPLRAMTGQPPRLP